MMSFHPSSAPEPGLRSRLVSSLALACLAALTAPGCRSTRDVGAREAVPKGAPSSTVGATDFNREATPEQAFNMHMELARARAAESNHEAAVGDYQLALAIAEKKGSLLSGARLGPEKQSLAHRRMGECFDNLGRFAQADVHYSKALKLTPNNPKVWNSAGYSYYVQNRLADSERALKTAAKLDPADAKIQTNLGLALAAAGKTDEALAALTRAGGPAAGQANLGFILAAMGKKDEARKHYQVAVSLQPDLAPAKQALAQLDLGKTDRAVAVASATIPDMPLPPLPALPATSPGPSRAAKPPRPARTPNTIPKDPYDP